MAQLENFRLKVFRAVAERLSFHKAAEDLFLTQPAVTLQIKALENDLGVRVFDRAGGRISLTPQGSVLLSYANKIAKLVAEAEGGAGKQRRPGRRRPAARSFVLRSRATAGDGKS